MYKLPLNREYLAAVRAGEKTATVREGQRSFPIGRAAIICGSDEILIEIMDVRHCRYQDLSEDDAIKDGFKSLAEMKSALEQLYSNLGPASDVTIVEFRLTL